MTSSAAVSGGLAPRPEASPSVEEKAAAKPAGDLKLRILSALVLAPLALAAVWLGGAPFKLLMLLAVAGMAFEWTRLSCGPFWPIDAVIITGTVFGAMLAAERAAYQTLGLIFLTGMALLAGFGWFSGRQYRWRMIGLPYIFLGPVSLVWLRSLEGVGFTLILWLLLVVWAMDIGAYFAGRAIGGPKLAPRASPNKTWSGLVGGMVAAGVAGAVIGAADDLGPVLLLAAASMVLGAWSQLGDIAESMVKRHFGVKDMSNLIPGHGGVLDRVDGLLFAAPVMVPIALFLGSK